MSKSTSTARLSAKTSQNMTSPIWKLPSPGLFSMADNTKAPTPSGSSVDTCAIDTCAIVGKDKIFV
jgi:hypothetical protein